MVGAARNVMSIVSNSMVSWKTVLTSEGMTLGQVDIRRGIFQGDSLTPLLFVVIMLYPCTRKDESLIQTR